MCPAERKATRSKRSIESVYPTKRLDEAQYLRYQSAMHITLTIGPLVSLIAGVLILTVPRLLNFIVAIYLIVIGLLGLFGAGGRPLLW